MKLKATLHRAPGPIDIEVTADGTSTVEDVARALVAADPAGPAGLAGPAGPHPGPDRLTLVAAEQSGRRALDPDRAVGEAGLRSGIALQVVPAPERVVDEAPAAVLRVLSGRHAGQEHPLRGGANVVGRDQAADVVIDDALVSKRHARINVDTTVEIVDMNSANGILMGGEQVARTVLSPGDVVLLGGTEISVIPLHRPGTVPMGGSTIEVVRSPRVVARYENAQFKAPKPPRPPHPQRLPWMAMLAPAFLGVAMFAITRSIFSVVFIALSPIMMLGAWLDQRIEGRKAFKRASAAFRDAIGHFEKRMAEQQVIERDVRTREVPALGDALASLSNWGDLTWTHRPEHTFFLTARLGTGRLPSRAHIEADGLDEALPEHVDEVLRVQRTFAEIDDVPVVADLREAGAVGIAGATGRAEAAARATVMQLVATHSPAELIVTAFVSPASRPEWSWLEWLPHVGSAHSPLAGAHLAANSGAAAALLSRIEDVVDARLNGGAASPRGPIPTGKELDQKVPHLPVVVVVVQDDAPADRGRLTRLVERGPDAGVHVVWVASTVGALPAACRTYLQVDENAQDTIGGMVRRGLISTPVEVELLDAQTATAWARVLAPTVDAGAVVADSTDLPRMVSFVDLSGDGLGSDPAVVIDRWRENDSITLRDGTPAKRKAKEGTLRALVGHDGAGAFQLDLRTQGPHALVGGTTGAGKSEFLQSWVLGMAAAHSPDRVTFLYVDYKGGSAFAECVDLPHTVGLVTDLSPHLVRRALTSLRAELRYREHLLNRKKAKDLVSLERTGDPECPPSLIIVVDEFAALVQEVPEFVDGIVDVAQRGRSLGLHLILATQRPAGVIRDNLRANTNLRVALRMADIDDSLDVLGDPMAGMFDPSIPGRGAAKSGPGRITSFQTGYVGGWTTGEKPAPQIDIRELDFGVGATWDAPAEVAPHIIDPGPTDIARIVRSVRAAASSLQIPAPRRPWLDELASAYDLARLPNPRTDERLLLGVRDDPASQAQPTIFYEPDRDGNVAIFGTGGSGKSTALRTFAVSAAITSRGGPVQVYGLDFGSSGLRMLESLPHVGAVIDGDDEERVGRLMRMLRDLVDERATRYAEMRAGTVTEYRRAAGRPDEPRILVLVDGVGAFREEYEFGAGRTAIFAAFAQIAVDGRQVGVHIVMTGDRPAAIPTSISSTVQRRFVLRMANDDQYLALDTPRDVLSPASPPGRAAVGNDELQFAVLGGSSNMAVQSREIEKLAAAMRRQGVPDAPPVLRLPSEVRLENLPATTTVGEIVIGLADLNLAPVGIAPHGAFMLAGSPGGGCTTALAGIAAGLRRADIGGVVHLAPRRPRAALASESELSAVGPEAVRMLADRLVNEVESGRFCAVLVEQITEFTGTEAEAAVDALVKAAIRAELLVVGEAESSTWSAAWQLGQPFKSARRGLLLTPSEGDSDTLFGTPTGRIKRSDFPAGRGFLIDRGQARKVQVALV